VLSVLELESTCNLRAVMRYTCSTWAHQRLFLRFSTHWEATCFRYPESDWGADLGQLKPLRI
jgi:hypothetical protein